MGDSKFCLLLLLSTSALILAQDDDQPTCLLAKRYKTLHKYEYQYEAESLNAITGASQLQNGPKASCKVEIEVPQTCSFIVHTTGCFLSEVVDMDAEGSPVFGPASGSDAFAAEMERYPLKVMVEGEYDVKLYPELGETTTILNFKRGIISALAVPLLEEEKNKNMPTIHGKCMTTYTVNAREDIATDIMLERDLSRCEKFVPIRDYTSPLALVSSLHYPLSKMITSTQTCNYKFDNEDKHMTSASCTEKHIVLPLSTKGEYGVTNVGKQELTLVQVAPHNDRVFDPSDNVKGLHMEAVEDKSAIQDKDSALNLLRELATLSETEGEKRAQLFQRLVTVVRGLKTETLSPLIPEALGVSSALTYQVLAQCGTPECSSAIMQILRTFDSSSVEVDAAVFALGLVSNPSALLINDMLEMAKYKPSKPIMYALSNAVKRFYKAEGTMIPEIRSVAEFMAAHLDDCTGDMDNTFMTLRVVGNMAPALVPASPALRAAVIQCVNQPEASPAVQQAAIQVYRLTTVPEEGREVLMQVLMDSASPMQKRIAAYLVLMKDPQPSELAQLANILPTEQDKQVQSFVSSHIMNILTSTEPETEELRQKIRDAMLNNQIGTIMDPTKFSRNYRFGSMEGNMIFEGTSYLPKEVMLEMTLKAFGFDVDMMEIGMEGKGFEPTVEALFGANGFFPDTALKTMYFVSENMPLSFNQVLQNLMPTLKKNKMNRQASQSLMRDIGRNLNKLVRDLKTVQSPEAMVYMRLLGNELGYMRTNDMEEMAYSAVMMIDNMLKMFPMDLMKTLMTKADNTIFAHYIFMDSEFFLPTVTGVPLRVALSGTFTPGIKGGLQIARDMSEFSFMPSAGVEFVTQVGSLLPEYVNSGLEMHTNIFHESGLKAKVSMERDNVKLTIPAPVSPTKLIKITNTLVAVTGSELISIPPMVLDKVEVRECTPFFAGMKYCTALEYIDASSVENTPYFPFTGDSKFAVEFHPTGEVTEYTAMLAYELLKEGEEGRQKVDSLKLIVRAEGEEPVEARAIMKYNRRKNTITADLQIPDYDVEAGIRLGVVDGNTKGKGTHSISLDFVNKNIPQLSMVFRANLKEMKEGMLQAQLLVPALSADAKVTANMKREEELELKLKSEVKVLDAISEQKIVMKYGDNKVEVEFKSDINTETRSLPFADVVEMYGNEVLDLQVGQTDMKVRHIFKTLVEAANNYMEKYGPFENLRVPDMPEISVPETLFLKNEVKGVYFFNNERFTIAIPLPLGGKSTEELKFPQALTTPQVSLPQFGLEIVSMKIPIPQMIVPERVALSIPLFGKAEISTILRSNLYDIDATVAAGKDVVETPSYSAKFDVTGTSPLDILSVKMEGSGMLATTESVKAHLKGSLVHKLLKTSLSIVEDATITDKVSVKSSSKFEATSPLGLSIDLEHTGVAGFSTEEITADSNLDGMIKAGPMFAKAISTQSYIISPFKPEAKIDSSIQFDSNIVKVKNTIAATLEDGELSVLSNTNACDDIFTHVAELSFKDNKLSLKCDTNAVALGMKIHNMAEASAGASEVFMRIETNADHTANRVYSLLTATFDTTGLTVNSDATVKLLENEATHKATLKMDQSGLVTKGTTTLVSPLSLENIFLASLDASGATLSISNKAAIRDIKADNANTLTITLSSVDFFSNAEVTASEYASYTHDVTIAIKPYTVYANAKNNLRLLEADVTNEAELKGEFYKMDLTGSLKATYGEQEIKHTYQMTYADMAANAKCSTTGKLFRTHMSHNTELEIIGLAARMTNDARFNSQRMRYDHAIRCSAVPFDFNLDAIFNADGDVTMYGKHSAQLYGKFLLKAQPLAFASSHENRASLTQQLDNGFSLKTTLDNKMDTVLSLPEQKTSFRSKIQINEHALNQDMSVYNAAERSGIEMSGTILTNILNAESTENQEYSLSGFVKYDKNTDSQIIYIPLMDNVPVLLETIKSVVVQITEALQDYINNEEVRAKLDALPQYVNDLVSKLNIEGNLVTLKEYFNDLTQNFVISREDVEASLENLKVTLQSLMTDLSVSVKSFIGMMADVISRGVMPEALVQKIQQTLSAINEEYEIKAMVISVIDTLREMVKQADLEKLRGSSIAFLCDIDGKYEVKAKLLTIMADIEDIIQHFELSRFVKEVKRFASDVVYVFIPRIPMKTLTMMTDNIMEMIQDLDIIGKINIFLARMRELAVKFEADKMVQVILDNALELFKKLRIQETIKTVIRDVMESDILSKLTGLFQDAITYLKTTEIKDMIQALNEYLENIVTELKSWDYNNLVNNLNLFISEYTSYINALIQKLEVPQKLEATREFVNISLSTLRASIERLREIKVAEIIKALKDIIDQVVFGNVRDFAEFIKQEITNLEVEAEITNSLKFVRGIYRRVLIIPYLITDIMMSLIESVIPDQEIIGEIKQMIDGLFTAVNNIEITIPSFVMPFTDLVVPSVKFSMDWQKTVQIPTQLDIPQFTIMNVYTVEATTISIDDIKMKIIDLIDMIVNFEIKLIDVDAVFGELKLSFLPSMSELNFPEITLPEIAFPAIPQIPMEKLVKSLQVPEIKLPNIPTEIMVPCFGKLYGEIKFNTPIYIFKTSAEIQNSTESEMTPTFTGFLTSQATSPSFEMLTYKLDSTARVAMPKRSRIVLAETLKFKHEVLGVEHQASVSLYGLSGQAQAKTTLKVTTTPYSAELINTGFIAMEEGMSASLETTYTHLMDFPLFNIRNDISLTQKAVLRQEGYTLTLTADNSGTRNGNAEDGNHKSSLHLSFTPKMAILTFSGDTDSSILKMKQQITGELAILSYLKFNIRNEIEAPFIKNSLILASGHASLYDMKAEIKANHDTELYGAVSGVVSNGINILVRPIEIVFEFQNKGNARVNIFDTLTAKIDLQNDYSATIKPEGQTMNTLAIARLNEFKMFYNFTVDNSRSEAALSVAMNGEANLDFLTSPISIPEIDLPFVNFRTPAISDLNLYEHTGLNDILTTTEQTVDVDAKIVYRKKQGAPLVDVMGLVQIPSLGDLITELTLKSAIINLNLNAGLYSDEDLVFRLGATTASVFESLKAKLDGTTSLTTKRGIKLANALSLENPLIKGTHDSTFSMNTETLDTGISVKTVAKIALPILNLEANQNLVVDTMTKVNAVSTLMMKADFNFPVINAVGKLSADQSLKMEGNLYYVSMESSNKANMDGQVLENYLVLGFIDNDFTLYLNNDGLRSTSKIIADAKINDGTTKIVGMDVNESLAVEASLSRVYAVLKYTGNNEANLFNFNTNGKHIAQATIDLAPASSLIADIEIDIAQPSSLGELTIFEKTVVDTVTKKISTNVKLVSPLYTTNLLAGVESNLPVIKVTFKSSATSVIVLLEYDMDASTTVTFENEALNVISKVVLNHAELNMDVNHAIVQVLKAEPEADDSSSRHTLNMDLTSPSFTGMNLRYASYKDVISATVSNPSAGFLGLQLNGKIPFQMSARVYARYPSTPEVDVDMLVIRSSPKDDDKTNLRISYNMEVPKVMLTELKTRLPSIISILTSFADKYQITRTIEESKNFIVTRVSNAYNAAINYDAQLSQLSIFFRNIFVQYQQTVQVFLDAVISVLRETQFKLPGSDEMTTLPEVMRSVTGSIAAMLDTTIQILSETMEAYYNSVVEKISSVKLRMPIGDVITGNQILEQVKAIFKSISDEMVDFVKNMESLDTMLVKIGETTKAVVEKSQEFVDSIKSDYLDALFVNINVLYLNFITAMKGVVDQVAAFDMEKVNGAFEYIMDMFIYVVDQFNNTVYGFLQQASDEAQLYVRVSEGRFDIDLPFPLQM